MVFEIGIDDSLSSWYSQLERCSMNQDLNDKNLINGGGEFLIWSGLLEKISEYSIMIKHDKALFNGLCLPKTFISLTTSFRAYNLIKDNHGTIMPTRISSMG